MPNTQDFSDIHAAAEAGDAAAVAAFLTADGRLVRAKDRWENTPLHHAADAEVARLLLGHGADANARGWVGATPPRPSLGIWWITGPTSGRGTGPAGPRCTGRL